MILNRFSIHSELPLPFSRLRALILSVALFGAFGVGAQEALHVCDDDHAEAAGSCHVCAVCTSAEFSRPAGPGAGASSPVAYERAQRTFRAAPIRSTDAAFRPDRSRAPPLT